MKLIGSKTEQEYRDELVNLCQSDVNSRLLMVLMYLFSDINTAYILYWIPEQEEDIYTILVNVDKIAVIELDRYNFDKEPIVKVLTIQQYKHKLSKIQQIKLTVAIDVAQGVKVINS